MNEQSILDDICRDAQARLATIGKRDADKIARRKIVLDVRTGSAGFSNTERLLYSITETAGLLSVTPRSIKKYIEDGILPSVKLGGRRLIPRDGLMEMISKKTTMGRGK